AELRAAGVEPAGLMAFTAERVRALEPERAADLDEKSIPHEVPSFIGRGDRAGAVHLEKGCYRGQETVARVENLGRSPRVLVMLQLDGSAPENPTPGSDISGPAGGRALGRIGTVVDDCDFGPIALGLIKRSALTGQDLRVGDVAVMVDPASLPEEQGEQAGRAAINRLRGR
ncbi:MAG: folate-binding protein, partial [Corynebacterium humireducens]|nr:folate-binding protein [Corynebacterium humireducens]